MKKHVIVLSLLLIFIGVYGWRLVRDAVNSYTVYEETNEQLQSAQTVHDSIEQEIKNSSDNLQKDYKLVQEGAYYDFCNDFIQSNYNIVQISTKKLSGSATTTIASYTSIDELHGANHADLLEITFAVEDLTIFLDFLDSNKYAIDELTIYPTDNMVIVTFLVGGGLDG